MTFAANFQKMLERSKGGIGQWVIIRHFSTEKSEFWDERAQEAIGGPPFKYTDTIVLASKQLAFLTARPAAKAGLTVEENVNALTDVHRYFLPPDVTIQEDDEIFDLDTVGQPSGADYTGSGNGARIRNKYKVRLVNSYRSGNQGEIQYILAMAKRYYGE